LSNDLTQALKERAAIERRSVTSILEEAGWDFMAKKGHPAEQEKRIERLVEAARA
jgi:hypothetical protein